MIIETLIIWTAGLNVLIALVQVAWKLCLEKDRVSTVLGEEEWHVTNHFSEPVQTHVPFVKVTLYFGKSLWTSGASECPPGSNLDWWFLGDVRHQKIHGNILAVHIFVHYAPYLPWQPVCVKI